MVHRNRLPAILWSCALILIIAGCNAEQAQDTITDAEETVEAAAGSIAEGAGEMVGKGEEMASEAVEKGKEMAGEFGEQAMAFLAPLKEKFGSLDELKESPEKLKQAVSELLTTIEEKAQDIKLPEAMSQSLVTIKEKLVELKAYLEGEYEQAKIDEYVKGISDSVKSTFGLSDA